MSSTSSCCGGNCGCGATCNCGSNCGGCNKYNMAEERNTATGTVILGVAPQKSHIDEVAAGPENGGCNCKCGNNCTCNPCNCK